MTVKGRLTRGVGGLYAVTAPDGSEYLCRARGLFRRDGMHPNTRERLEYFLTMLKDEGEEHTFKELKKFVKEGKIRQKQLKKAQKTGK